MFMNNVKVALRILKKNKIYSLITIAGFSMGITCCILIFLYVKYEFSYDRYHKNAEHIFRVIKEMERKGERELSITTPPPLGPALYEEFAGVTAYARIIEPYPKTVLMSVENKRFYENKFLFAEGSLFDIFTFPFVAGNPKTALNELYTVVITESTAEKYFGKENPLGKIITLNNEEDFIITGVMKDVPGNSHFSFDFAASFATLKKHKILPLQDWGSCALYTYLQIPGGSAGEIEKKIPEFITKYAGQDYFVKNFTFQPITRIHLHSDLSGEIEKNGDITYVYIFSAISVVILFIACINFINLTTARYVKRAGESGMRKVLGAQKTELIKQYTGESILLTCITLPVSLGMLLLVSPLFNNILNTGIKTDLLNNLGIITAVTILAGISAGLYPALFLSSFKPVHVLTGAVKSGSSKPGTRNVLVLFQFILSTLFIYGTVIINKQMTYLHNKKLGYNKEQIVVIPVKERENRRKMHLIKNELMKNPNILSITASSDVPGYGGINSHLVIPEGFTEEDRLFMHNIRVDHDFIETMEMVIKQGRNFSSEIPTDMSSAFILNEAAVKKIGWNSPEGKKFEWRRNSFDIKQGTVIDIVEDFHFKSLHHPIEPLAIQIDPRNYKYIIARISSGNIKNTLEFIKNTWHEFSPQFPFEYSFLDDDYEKLYKSEERMSRLFGYVSFLSVFIASLGLLGLASFSAEQRTKEIGIRKVLGASVPGIFFLLSREFLKWVVIANLVAFPFGYFIMKNWLQNFAYRTDIGFSSFLVSLGIALLTALFTISYWSLKAAFTNPVKSLRHE